MAVDTAHLRSFVEVVERGTAAAAADALGYTAPAVSQHLAKLERRLGTPLFERVGGRLRPNEAARRLVPLALDLLDAEERCLAVAPRSGPVPVTVAGFASALAQLLVPALPALADRFVVRVVEAEDVDALRDLSLGHADVALVQEYDGAREPRPARFAYTSVVRDRLRLVLPPDRPAATVLAELDGTPWLVNGHGTRCADAVARLLARAGIVPDVVGSVADNHALLTLVAAGHGAAIVPELVLAGGAPGVTVADQPLRAHRTVWAVTRRTNARSLRPLVGALVSARG